MSLGFLKVSLVSQPTHWRFLASGTQLLAVSQPYIHTIAGAAPLTDVSRREGHRLARLLWLADRNAAAAGDTAGYERAQMGIVGEGILLAQVDILVF